jgi:Na+-translocating ferredoxin:NAD+ oxidoreductase subunit B
MIINREKKDQIYWNLARYLDRLPGGFGTQDPAVEQRLLEKLFTPEEAELAVYLNIDRENAEIIAERAGLSVGEVENRLDTMAQKGLIFSVISEQGIAQYQAVPWVIGIYEFQIDRLDTELLRHIHEYWGDRKPSERPTLPQMRTIPIQESIDVHLEVLPYENVDALIAEEGRFAVAPCICRHTAKMAGGGCDAPEDTCLIFGDFADYYVRTGRGRPIDRDQVKQILVSANEANLVLQPSNSKKPDFICCCCGCCCGILYGIKQHPKPSDVIVNAFIAHLETDICENCEICLERCQTRAFSTGATHVILNTDRCIGCGLCVSTCPTEALTLTRKQAYQGMEPPRTFDDTIRKIMEVQGSS